MNKTSNKAFAKINLTLDVLGTLENGYHEVLMVMQTVSLYDIVTVSKAEQGIELSVNLPYLPKDSGNIAYKAAENFFEYTKIKNCGVKIDISKRIPVGAGLAGGSSNAAATLKAMNRLFNAKLSTRELCTIGASLGADVPYCILGGTRLASGIGDRLSPLTKMPECYIVLVKPAFSISTPSVYKKFDLCTDFARPDTDKVIEGLKQQDLTAIVGGMENVLEAVCLKEHPILVSAKKDLIEMGAIASQMSGSGPTVFGIFNTYDEACKAKEALRKKYKTVYICSPV